MMSSPSLEIKKAFMVGFPCGLGGVAGGAGGVILGFSFVHFYNIERGIPLSHLQNASV